MRVLGWIIATVIIGGAAGFGGAFLAVQVAADDLRGQEGKAGETGATGPPGPMGPVGPRPVTPAGTIKLVNTFDTCPVGYRYLGDVAIQGFLLGAVAVCEKGF